MRGKRGVPGPPGPAGPTGTGGPAGHRGASGRRGATGERGAQGQTGAVGPQGSSGGRSRIKQFADVDQHITRIDHELNVQMKRMSQIQAELDDLRRKVRRLLDSSK
jgi:hypothetical protein